MKEKWTYKKLGEVCEILNGFAFKSDEYENNGIRVMRITNVQKGEIVDDDPKFFPLKRKDEITKYILREGDVLMSLTGNVGRVGIMEERFLPAALNQRVACLRLIDNEIDKRYLFHILNSDTFENDCVFNAAGIAQKNMSTRWLEQYKIPVPPIETQSRIVSELDLLQSIIDKQKAQLKELDNLAQAVFYDMFGDPVENDKGWEVKTLKESVIEMFLGPFGSALKTDCYVEKENSFCMVYEQKHAIKKTMDVDTHYIDKEKYDSLKRFEVHSGDFIMSCRGTIGEIYRIPNNAPFGIIHPSLMKIRIREDVYHPTFFLWLLSRIIKNENTNGNCVQMAITAKELGTRKPILPPLYLQQSFAAKIESIEKQKTAITQSIAETQRLFDYTMDKYFG